jgi:LysR family transcriptional activator of nhaA
LSAVDGPGGNLDWLNYHHLYYFWTVAREGGVVNAAERLSLAPPTVSAQVRTLEDSLGVKLFDRSGRNLVLTESGQVAFRYADEIFAIGKEMTEVLSGKSDASPSRLMVGVADVIPKAVAMRLLEPALQLPSRPRLVVIEDKPDRLLAELAVHRLDVVLTDAPMHPALKIRAWSHLLGECGVSFLAGRNLALPNLPFPKRLDGLPFFLPLETSTLRRSLDLWFESVGVRVKVVGELEDSALIKAFGQKGLGAFVVPTPLEAEICEQTHSVVIGRAESVRERFYAVTVERRIRHPAVLAIANAAHAVLTVPEGSGPIG